MGLTRRREAGTLTSVSVKDMYAVRARAIKYKMIHLPTPLSGALPAACSHASNIFHLVAQRGLNNFVSGSVNERRPCISCLFDANNDDNNNNNNNSGHFYGAVSHRQG